MNVDNVETDFGLLLGSEPQAKINNIKSDVRIC